MRKQTALQHIENGVRDVNSLNIFLLYFLRPANLM